MTPNPFSGGVVAGDVRSTPLPAGIGPGALVRTFHGERVIETLAPGDRILTADGTRARLGSVSCHVVPAHGLCRISPKALAEGRTGKCAAPIVVSDQQHIVVKGWLAQAMFGRDRALVPVSAIIDQELVRRININAELPLFQLHFDEPKLLRVGGLDLFATPIRQPALEPAKRPAF